MRVPILGFVIIPIFILQFSTLTNSRSINTQFIKTTCNNTTTYPRLCYHSLSIYASKIKTSPKILAHTALNVTLKATKSTSTLVKKVSRMHGLSPRTGAAIADCVEVVGDSVYELQRSIGEIDEADQGSRFNQVMGDIQTWVSAALTDDETCMDGFAGQSKKGKIKNLVRKHILKISHLTSNALALVNNYASSVSN